MPTSTWKSVERRVADTLGGERVGNSGSNTEDVAHPVFSIEVKHRKKLPALITTAYAQCKKNAPPAKVPLLVIHEENSRQLMAVIDLDDLHRLLGSLYSVPY